MAELLDYPRTLFVERQTPRGWPLWLSLAPVTIAGGGTIYMAFFAGGAPVYLRTFAVTMVIMVPALIFMQRLAVSVTSHELTIRYSLLRTMRLNLADVAEAHACTYEPLKEFGGWGMKWSLRDSTTSYTMHGNRGVRIVTTSGKKLLVGSQRADELAAAINQANQTPTNQ